MNSKSQALIIPAHCDPDCCSPQSSFTSEKSLHSASAPIDLIRDVDAVDETDVLVIIAHPDDEIFVSGTICLCIEKAFRVTLVCVTDGEGGTGNVFGTEIDLRFVRKSEISLSSQVLGAHQLLFLSLPDVAPDDWVPTSWDQFTLTNTLRHIIQTTRPKVILSHGPRGGYGHPAHKLLSRLVIAGARMASFSGSVYSFCGQFKNAFFTWHFDDPSHVLVDARCYLDRRAASLSYHQSQLHLFLRPHFPRTFRQFISAFVGSCFSCAEAARRRVPIGTSRRFFSLFPTEGLVLRIGPPTGPHFFLEHFANDPRVTFFKQ